MSSGPSHPDVVVIGAGFAGVSTALALARRRAGRVLVLDSAPGPGHHASGRNAAMFRRVVADPVLARLATESHEALRRLEERRGRRLLEPVGGLLIGSNETCFQLLETARSVPALAREVEAVEGSDLDRLVPALAGSTSRAGVHSPGCGVVDIHGLLTELIEEAREAGVVLQFRQRVTGLCLEGGRVIGVQTTGETLPCGVVVNAAGHGAGPVGAMAGPSSVLLTPSRRHLYVTEPTDRVAPRAPYVWDVTRGFYFRPEGSGLLVCACDETPWTGEEPTVDLAHREVLAERLVRHAPSLAGIRPARAWVGLRTLTPDGRFIIGRDRAIEGVVWVSGLGGHGLTTALGVGALGAAAVIDGRLPAPFDTAFDPSRWSRG